MKQMKMYVCTIVEYISSSITCCTSEIELNVHGNYTGIYTDVSID